MKTTSDKQIALFVQTKEQAGPRGSDESLDLRGAGLSSILTFSNVDSVKFGDFEPCEGRWGLDTAHASDISVADVEEEMEWQIAAKTGHPAKVEIFHSNGHAITAENPGHGTFVATRK